MKKNTTISPRARAFKKASIYILVFIGLLLVYLLSVYVRDFINRDREDNFTLYPGFGIYMPDGYGIHGIDVSRYQKKINWTLVRQMKERDIKIGFAIIKATEGNSLVDVQFERNWRKAREARIPRGAYHFFIPYRDGKVQARHFIKNVQLLPGDLPPVLDIETLKGSDADEMINNAKDFARLIEDHYGVKPIIYSNAHFYNQYLDAHFADYPLWVAHYFERKQPRVRRSWLMWQHSESGRVNGINSPVDFNVFSGDSADFRAMLLP